MGKNWKEVTDMWDIEDVATGLTHGFAKKKKKRKKERLQWCLTVGFSIMKGNI